MKQTVGTLLFLSAVFVLGYCAAATERGHTSVDVSYDSLMAHVEQLRADSAARARADSVTHTRIVSLERSLSRSRAQADTQERRADSLEQAFRFTLPDALVAAFDSVVATRNAEVVTLRAALATSDSLLALERERVADRDVAIGELRRTLTSALAQVEAERRERSAWKMAKRAAPWLVAAYALGKANVP